MCPTSHRKKGHDLHKQSSHFENQPQSFQYFAYNNNYTEHFLVQQVEKTVKDETSYIRDLELFYARARSWP